MQEIEIEIAELKQKLAQEKKQKKKFMIGFFSLSSFLMGLLLLQCAPWIQIPAAASAVCSAISNLVTSMTGASSTTSTTATFTPASGSAYTSFTVDLGTGYQAGNICSTATIFGLAGSASCISSSQVMQSNALRNITSTQITQAAEVGTAAASGLGTGYRDTPISISDDEGAFWVGYCASNTANTQALCTAAGGTYTWLSSICVDQAYTTQASCTGAGGSHTWIQNTGSTCTNATQGSDGNSCSTSYPIMSSTHAGFSDCGGNAFANIAASVANCASVNGAQATWNGAVLGGHGEASWVLVARKGANKEVWQDQRTGLIWSSLVSTSSNWCRASGNAETPANGGTHCTPGGVNQSSPAVSFCTETSGQVPGAAGDTGGQWQLGGRTYDNAKGGMGLQSALSVRWRLPTRNDYMQAELDGIRYVMPDAGALSPSPYYEWSASLVSYGRSDPWVFYGRIGVVSTTIRTDTDSVRCVGR